MTATSAQKTLERDKRRMKIKWFLHRASDKKNDIQQVEQHRSKVTQTRRKWVKISCIYTVADINQCLFKFSFRSVRLKAPEDGERKKSWSCMTACTKTRKGKVKALSLQERKSTCNRSNDNTHIKGFQTTFIWNSKRQMAAKRSWNVTK